MSATAPALERFETNARGMAQCPAHEDRVRSLSVRQGDDGRALVKCQAGCPTEAVVAAVGLTMADLFAPRTNGATRPDAPEAIYRYHDAEGREVYQVWRWGKAHEPPFSMHKPDGSRGVSGIPRVPYRLPELLAAPPERGVVIVEGEKDADRLASLGFIATTNAGGAGQWDAAWSHYLADRIVVILPDNDPSGREHAADIAKSLRGIARSVKVVELPGIPAKGDVTDYLNAGHTTDELRLLMLNAPAEAGPESIRDRLGFRWMADIADEPLPPLYADRLDPTGHTILYGPGGVGKGVLTSWWIVQLQREGHRVLILDYEDHVAEWKRRITGLGGPDAWAGVGHVSPLATTWRGASGGLPAQAADLHALAVDVGATFVVIDSIVPACGSDPLKPEVPGAYAAALVRIGLPSLSLGHVTKGDDVRYPFGSVFWHNLARVAWSLTPDRDERAILTHRKHNNYPKAGRVGISVTWRDDRPVDVLERPYAAVLADRIAEALSLEPLTVAGIVAALNDEADELNVPKVKADSIRKTLRRGITSHPQRFTVTGDDDELSRWGLV